MRAPTDLRREQARTPTLIRHCLFCDTRFPDGESFPGFATGRQAAWDPGRSRVWAICDECHHWTLAPFEDRLPIIETLDRTIRDRGRSVASTAHVELYRTDTHALLRVGTGDLAEESWWRYGRELRRRRSEYERRESRWSAYSMAALATVSEALGLTDRGLRITWDESPVADVLRWRRFPWAAWHGRIPCPSCASVLLAVRFDLSWWLRPLSSEQGRLVVGVPCDRCDPWTPDKVYRIAGDEAAHLLRRVLAYQQIEGASDRMLEDASASIRAAGSSRELFDRVAGERGSLWGIGPARRLALEIAVNQEAERSALHGVARYFERRWREEDEIARIADEELTFPPR